MQGAQFHGLDGQTRLAIATRGRASRWRVDDKVRGREVDSERVMHNATYHLPNVIRDQYGDRNYENRENKTRAGQNQGQIVVIPS